MFINHIPYSIFIPKNIFIEKGLYDENMKLGHEDLELQDLLQGNYIKRLKSLISTIMFPFGC